ncbi:MAG TPA: polysaccharide deacetylase family protein [Vicinamibacteria bacterium]|nr:polysaccharide deacetylase family protein [Vicinamibacteria bacterium]
MSTAFRARLRRAVVRVAAQLGRDENDGLRILTYHRVNDHHPKDRLTVRPDAFRSQMEILRSSGRPVLSLGQAVRALRGEAPLPEEAVVVTFDDGYADNYEVALPILDRLGLSATFFLATGFMDGPRTLERYLGCCDRDGMLAWDQVREMKARGHELGGHGRAHLELAPLEHDRALEEIEGCAADLVAQIGERPRLFCYPRGSESGRVRELVAERGFEAACTVYPGANGPGTPLLGLKRTEVSGADDLEDFRLKLRGDFDSWHAFVQIARGRATRD